MQKTRVLFIFIAFLSILGLKVVEAQINLPSWPTAQKRFFYSDKYQVTVKQGSGTFQTVKTLQSKSQDELVNPGENGLFKARTFNYAPLSFNSTGGALTVRVKKLNITGVVNSTASNVEVIGRSGKITTVKRVDNNTVEFTLAKPDYVSVNFQFTSNENTNNGHKVVKHMMMVFADKHDSDLTEPTGTNKVIYSSTTTKKAIRNADIVVFRAGFHDIKSRWGLNGLQVNEKTKVWLAPGAVVSANIRSVKDDGTNSGRSNILIYGRGILFLGDYRESDNVNRLESQYWARGRDNNHLPAAINLSYVQGATGQNFDYNEVRGIMVADIMFHGIVPGYNSAIKDVKLWGWHDNNDGFRPGPGSTVTGNFMRMVDDGLYVNSTVVTDNMFWPSYNGSIVTCGWELGNNAGGMTIRNSTVLYPEWVYRGNNNGVFMSQLGDKAECVGVQFINMKIYGDPIALFNLKPSSNRARSGTPSSPATLPGVRDILFKDVTIFGKQKGPNLLQSDAAFTVKGIKLENVKITGFADRFLTNADRSNTALFSGNNLTNDSYLFISSGSTTTTASAPIGKRVAFKSMANSKYVSQITSDRLQALDATNQGTQNRFDIIDAGGGYVALRGVKNSKFVVAENAGTLPLIANRTTIGDWEKFTWIQNTDGTVSLRAKANNLVVQTPNAGAGELIAKTANVAGSWEKFQVDIISNTPASLVSGNGNDRLLTTGEVVRVFPNPTTGALNIANLGGTEQITIFNITGQQVFQQIGQPQMDIKELPKGIYFVNIGTRESVRIVKQ